jgi:hypothetical protein
MFKEGDKWHINLKNVLMSYILYNPSIGYIQGMNELSSIVYVQVQDEFTCFMMLANLIEYRRPIKSFLTVNLKEMEIQY